jgi:hypothetical protein
VPLPLGASSSVTLAGSYSGALTVSPPSSDNKTADRREAGRILSIEREVE